MKSAVDAAMSRKTVRFEPSKVNLIYASKKKKTYSGRWKNSKTLMSATTNYTATLDTLFPEQNNSEGGVGEEAREGRVVSEFYSTTE